MENKITVISGGSGGIGRSVVRKFLEKDTVIVLDINEINDERILKNENFYFIKTDVTNPLEIENAKMQIKTKYGRISNLISMAGINMKSEIGGMKHITFDDIDKSIKLNLNSHIYLAKSFIELLENEEGIKNFIMISSINAISDYGLPAYSAAKSGLYGFMKAVTKEFGKYRIRTNTVSLGTVPHNSDVIEGNEYFESKIDSLPLQEFVRPKDVSSVIYSLVYDLKGITGQNIVVDGGQSV